MSRATDTEPSLALLTRPTADGGGTVPVDDGIPLASRKALSHAMCAVSRFSRLSCCAAAHTGPEPSLAQMLAARLKNPVAWGSFTAANIGNWPTQSE